MHAKWKKIIIFLQMTCRVLFIAHYYKSECIIHEVCFPYTFFIVVYTVTICSIKIWYLLSFFFIFYYFFFCKLLLEKMLMWPPLADVGVWLKSLRLHKYEWLVGALDYHQLLHLDDETLEAKGVTKGARHKLLLSIARLGQREHQLLSIEKVFFF